MLTECDAFQEVSSPNDVEMSEAAHLPPRQFGSTDLDELKKNSRIAHLKEILYLRRIRSIFWVAKNEEERNSTLRNSRQISITEMVMVHHNNANFAIKVPF